MNPEVKALWLQALRSGEYTQTKQKLRDEAGMCCLGVLCDIYEKQTGFGHWQKSDYGYRFIAKADESRLELPVPVQEWAGSRDGATFLIDGTNITIYNDGGDGINRHSFAEIADLIETHL